MKRFLLMANQRRKQTMLYHVTKFKPVTASVFLKWLVAVFSGKLLLLNQKSSKNKALVLMSRYDCQCVIMPV